MHVGPAAAFQPSTDLPVDAAGVRAGQTPLPPAPGGGSSGESDRSAESTSGNASPQDVVKVQLEPPGEIVVYQFVDQRGTVVLQVPPQQLLNLAQQISQELERKPASQPIPEGGNPHGH